MDIGSKKLTPLGKKAQKEKRQTERDQARRNVEKMFYFHWGPLPMVRGKFKLGNSESGSHTGRESKQKRRTTH